MKRLADKLVSLLVKGHLQEEILGDMDEFYSELTHYPKWKRSMIYMYQTLHLVRSILVKSISGTQKLNYLGMIKLYIRTAIRTFLKNRVIAIPSMITLVFGALSFQMIFSWVSNELSMDDFHSKIDRIYMGAIQTNPQADISPLSPQKLFRLDYDQYPEVQNTLLIHIYEKDEIKLTSEAHEFGGKGLVVDSSFFEFFDFQIHLGDQHGLLHDPSHIVLSGNFANRVFGDVNPIGKTVQVSCDREGLYTVAAVTEEIPANSSIDFDFIIPTHSQRFWRRIPMDLILFNESFDFEAFSRKVKTAGRETNPRFPESIISFVPISRQYFEQPLDVALFGKQGDRDTVNTMIFIGLTIILITFLGFNNLQSTSLLSGAEQLGIKQMIGGSKGTLSAEMIVHRVIYFLIASGLTILLYQSLFPYYRTAFNLGIDSRFFFSSISIISVIGFLVAICIMVSAIQIYGLKVNETVFRSGDLFRIPKMQRSITVVQYAVSIVLLISTAVVFMQYKFMANKELGFKYQDIVSVNFFEISSNEDQAKSYDYVKNQLKANSKVVASTQGGLPVNSESYLSSWKKAGQGEEYESRKVMAAGSDYLKVLGIGLREGRFFSDSLDKPDDHKVVINEAAKKFWGIGDITKTKLVSNTSGRAEFEFEIIGVVEDFHFEHLSKKIEPLILQNVIYPDENFLVRFKGREQQAGISFLEGLYKEVNPNKAFDYDLLDHRIALQYDKEKSLGKVYVALTIVALLLSSISLFTFSVYESKRRTKEIGIRKVNGATHMNIFRLMSFSLLKTILVAFLIAVPFAWYFTNQWIQQFAYQSDISWWVFIISGLLVGSLALVAILWQVRMVATQNPVHSLRYE